MKRGAKGDRQMNLRSSSSLPPVVRFIIRVKRSRPAAIIELRFKNCEKFRS